MGSWFERIGGTVVEVVVPACEVSVQRVEVFTRTARNVSRGSEGVRGGGVRGVARTAGLLDAVADRGELVGEVLTAGVGRVLRTSREWGECGCGCGCGRSKRPGTHEVALNDKSEAATDDAVALRTATRTR